VERLVEDAFAFASLDGYRRYLCAAGQARAPLEERVAAATFAEPFNPWRDFRIAPALAADLADIGASAAGTEGLSDPNLSGQNDAFALGILYVLAGSCLGAAILRDRAGAIGLSATHGARHLHLQADAARHWPQFVDAFDRLDMDDSAETACRAGAQAAFAIFERSFGIGL
jgi:heme oxygenase